MDLKGNGVSRLWICSERSVRWIGRSARSMLGLIGLAGVLDNNGTPPYSSLDSDLSVCGTFSSIAQAFSTTSASRSQMDTGNLSWPSDCSSAGRLVDAMLSQLKPPPTKDRGNHCGAFHTTEEQWSIVKGLDRDRPGNPLHTLKGKPGVEGVEGVMLCSVMNASRRMGAQHGVLDQCEDMSLRNESARATCGEGRAARCVPLKKDHKL